MIGLLEARFGKKPDGVGGGIYRLRVDAQDAARRALDKPDAREAVDFTTFVSPGGSCWKFVAPPRA